MIFYLKENGYPMFLCIETGDHENKETDWKGYESIVTDEDGNVIHRFFHDKLNDRVHWAMGFFEGLKYEVKLSEYETFDCKYGMQLIEDEKSNIKIGDWVVTIDGKIQKIKMDDDPEMPLEIIKRFASSFEVKNHLIINNVISFKDKFEKTGYPEKLSVSIKHYLKDLKD